MLKALRESQIWKSIFRHPAFHLILLWSGTGEKKTQENKEKAQFAVHCHLPPDRNLLLCYSNTNSFD